MKKLRVGVVGVGHIGTNHARLYAEVPTAELTAIYDIDPVTTPGPTARPFANQWVYVSNTGARGLTGKECQAVLDEAGITINKNTIPFETRSPFQASGIRLGTPAVTTRGMREPEMAAIADMISEVLMDIKNIDTLTKVRRRVHELTARFPLPY